MKALHNRYGRLAGHLLALTFCVTAPAAPLMAQEYGIIDDVRTGTSAQGPQIRISFTKAAQYTGHTPKEESRQLFIDLRTVGPAPAQVQVPSPQELRFTPTAEIPLTKISYRDMGRGVGRLELNFNTSVRYQVSGDSDYRGVTITLGDKASQAQPKSKAAPLASPVVEKRVAELMEKARIKMIEDRDFARAISLYQQVLDQPANSRSREALEYLGLARERAGQMAKAKWTYKEYLKRYPEGEASERVRQRLMSLTTATASDKEQLREGWKTRGARWDYYGTFSQYYLHDVFSTDEAGTQTTVSAFSTDIDFVGTRRSSSSDSRLRVTTGYYHDLKDNNNDDTRVSSLYVEHNDRDIGWWARAGRQSSHRDGALGRFDGLKLGYELSKRMQVSVYAGHPVESTRDGINDSRTFTGVALDLGPYADSLEFSLYALDQEVDSLVDRRAVGSEMRYFRNNLTVLGMVDYDTFYKELNIATLLANWMLKDETTLNASYDVRKAPTLSTRNALMGQGVDDIAQLSTIKMYTDDQIYQLARDRTAETRTVSLGASRPMNKRLRLAVDLSVMNTSATVASPVELGDVPATEASDNEYFINLQAIGTGVLNGDDVSSLGLHYTDSASVTGYGLYASSRLPYGNWRYYPRLRIDHRSWHNTEGTTQWILGPVVRAEYTWDNLIFEGEIGGEWTNNELPDATEQTLGIYGSIGYRYEF